MLKAPGMSGVGPLAGVSSEPPAEPPAEPTPVHSTWPLTAGPPSSNGVARRGGGSPVAPPEALKTRVSGEGQALHTSWGSVPPKQMDSRLQA